MSSYESLYKTEKGGWVVLRHDMFARPGHAINISNILEIRRHSATTCKLVTLGDEYEVNQTFEVVMETILE